MKKLLLVALIGLGLAVVDAEARYRNCNRGSCNTSCNMEPADMCGQPPCCEREETITVRVPAQKVCGWVCPTGACEVPYDQARHVTQD